MLAEAIAEVLVLGLAVALSPLAVIAVTVLLTSPGGTGPAWAFLGAWVASLGAVSTAVTLLGDAADANAGGEPATWTALVRIGLALLLVAFAARAWRGRGGAEDAGPAWLARLDGMGAAQAAGLAVLLAAVKPKNLLLASAAGVAVAQTGAAAGAQAAALAVFVALGALAPGIPLALHTLAPRRSPALLAGLRDWLTRENEAILAVLATLLAAKLLGDALGTLG
jgi:hypothetical protein